MLRRVFAIQSTAIHPVVIEPLAICLLTLCHGRGAIFRMHVLMPMPNED